MRSYTKRLFLKSKIFGFCLIAVLIGLYLIGYTDGTNAQAIFFSVLVIVFIALDFATVFGVTIDGMISDNGWSGRLIAFCVCELVSYILLCSLLEVSRSDWITQWCPDNNIIMIAVGQFLVLDLVALIFGLLTPAFSDKPPYLPL